ncbi:MAG: hypothetical protein HQL51_11180 [Magnetococcales bacterium]|nr:hypothetical protein [Magnetococcales bacterium]
METQPSGLLTKPVHFIMNGVCVGDPVLKPVQPAPRKEAKAQGRNQFVLPPARRVLAGTAQIEKVAGRGRSRIGSSFFRLTPTATTALAF